MSGRKCWRTPTLRMTTMSRMTSWNRKWEHCRRPTEHRPKLLVERCREHDGHARLPCDSYRPCDTDGARGCHDRSHARSDVDRGGDGVHVYFGRHRTHRSNGEPHDRVRNRYGTIYRAVSGGYRSDLAVRGPVYARPGARAKVQNCRGSRHHRLNEVRRSDSEEREDP